MRLNKSFSEAFCQWIREKMRLLGQRSGYITYSLMQTNAIFDCSKRGRAKDGLDQTDPAIH